MNYLYCDSGSTHLLNTKTSLGYELFHCRECAKQYSERTDTALNFIKYPTAAVMLVVYHYVRIKLSLNDIVEFITSRGFHLNHQTVHNWA